MTEYSIALAGNPNVGKSCLFNHLTGVGAIVSNYPGTTVEVSEGNFRRGNSKVHVIDLPGTYSLGDSTEDERITKKYILEKGPDVVINLVDANNLERHLYLTMQMLELKLPLIVAINFYEEAKDKGIIVNCKELSKTLGVPVIPFDALRGAGVEELVEGAFRIFNKKTRSRHYKIKYSPKMEHMIKEITNQIAHTKKNVSKRVVALHLIEESGEIWESFCKDKKKKLKSIMKKSGGKKELVTSLAKERHGHASLISEKVTTFVEKPVYTLQEKMDRLTTEPLSGTIVLFLVLSGLFFLLFSLGGFLEEIVIGTFDTYIAPTLNSLISNVSNKILAEGLRYSFVLGLEAGLAIALPYIFVFYFVLGFLEDTGYLPRISYLLDKTMHRIGLHGKSILPMMVGFGCSVPAILATRVLNSERERLLTSVLICLIPCSAITSIIIGSVGHHLGVFWALLIYLIVIILMFSIGYILSKILPGEKTGLILELPLFRMPSGKNITHKTWLRMKEFVHVAFPILIVGSGALGMLKAADLLDWITYPLKPMISGWLMLPDAAGITLIYGIMRKEMALETLIALGGSYELTSFMTPLQVFIFALVTTLYIPCIATMAVLKKEFGWMKTIYITFGTIFLAVFISGLAGRVLLWTGLL